jgi:hypothetical protein
MMGSLMTKLVSFACGLLGFALWFGLVSGGSMAQTADLPATEALVAPLIPGLGADAFEGLELVPPLSPLATGEAELVGYEMLLEAVPAGLAATPDPGYKVTVRESGLYELSYGELAAAGLPVDTLDPATLQMFYHDQEMAVYVAGEGDGSFDAEDYLLFYGEAISGKYLKYTEDNVYWLSYGQEVGLRMPEVDAAPAGGAVPVSFEELVHFETDAEYWSEMPGEGDDFSRWYWDYAEAPGSMTHTAALTDVVESTVSEPLTATIRVAMVGYTPSAANPDQHIVVWVNENWVGEFEWDGVTSALGEFEFDQGYLNPGTGDNSVRFEAVLNPGVSYSDPTLDWFEVGYQRAYRAEGDALSHGNDVTGDIEVDGFTSAAYALATPEERADLTTFDVTDPLAVTRVLNTEWEESDPGYYRVRFADTLSGVRGYWTGLPSAYLSPVSIESDSPSDLRSTANSADYIIISHGDFYSAVEPLRDYYNGTGLVTVLVDVQDVYDEFSGGVFYPGAIRDFLSYAYHNWDGGPPGYVLLVGDGHWDFKNLLGTSAGQYIPPYLSYVDPIIGETAADNRYVAVDGDDPLPDMALGRFPVNTPAEAAAMVLKSINYQTQPPDGDWNSNMLFVADNDEAYFRDLSDDIIQDWVPETYTTTTIYYGTEGYTSAAVTRDAITAAISDGQLFVSYIGHAAITWWAAYAEQLLRTSDVAGLTNGGMLPIMLPMTCQEGFFAHPSPSFSGLSEVLVRATSGGAVASFAPTGWGVAAGHDYLQKGFFDAIYNQGVERLGDATDAGKQYLWDNSNGAYHDLLDTYVLLGDPALKINLSTEDPTGVQLDYFTAQTYPIGQVTILWKTITEVGTLGFNVYRQVPGGERLRLNPVLIRSHVLPGSPVGAAYEFVDGGAVAGVTYDYWLEEIDLYGKGTLYGPLRVSVPGISRVEYRTFLPWVQCQD